MNSNRTLSNAAQAAIAGFFNIPGSGDAWAQVLSTFSETELQECERVIGLNQPNAAFRKGIADAVFFGIVLHHAAPKRASTVRGDFQLVSRSAAAAAAALQELSAALDQTVIGDQLPEPLALLMAPLTHEYLRALTEAVQKAADRCRDLRGRRRMAAFDLFVRLLADAFARATGHPAGLTWSEHRGRYEGRFWELIARVLPVVAKVNGKGFVPATDQARGRKVQRILSAMDNTPAIRS